MFVNAGLWGTTTCLRCGSRATRTGTSSPAKMHAHLRPCAALNVWLRTLLGYQARPLCALVHSQPRIALTRFRDLARVAAGSRRGGRSSGRTRTRSARARLRLRLRLRLRRRVTKRVAENAPRGRASQSVCERSRAFSATRLLDEKTRVLVTRAGAAASGRARHDAWNPDPTF